jgi:hypothetical protein
MSDCSFGTGSLTDLAAMAVFTVFTIAQILAELPRVRFSIKPDPFVVTAIVPS